MYKMLAALGIVGAAGALWMYDVRTSGPSHGNTSLVSAAYATPAPVTAAQAATSIADADTVTLNVKGMTCGGCVIGVRKVLTRLTGVLTADVSYERSRAVVTYDPAKITVQQLIAAIKELGYTATVVTG